MDNKIKLFGIVFLICLVLPIVNAKTQFSQTINIEPQNQTNVLADHIIYTYLDKDDLDFISGNQPLNVYVLYSMYPKTWNEKNPSYRVDWCNFTIQTITGVQQSTQVIYSEIVTENDIDINNKKYFLQMNDNDLFIADIYCKFENQIPSRYQMPETMQIVTPTWNCRACQYYEWLQSQTTIQKAVLTGNNTTSIIEYITEFLTLHFEIFLTLFWIFTILIFFTIISLVFMAMFWIYEYVRGIAK